MAQRTVTILSDDLDGKEGRDIATVTFGFDGSTYAIDLSKKNRAGLEKALSPYIDAARKVSSAPRRSPGRRPAGHHRGSRVAARQRFPEHQGPGPPAQRRRRSAQHTLTATGARALSACLDAHQ